MRGGWLIAAVAAVALAGCVSPENIVPSEDAPAPAAFATHVLANATEPDGLTAPTFDLVGAIAKTGPVYGGGEPSIWAALDGTIWIAFPGCDTGPYLVDVPGQPTCDHGPVYKSVDGGATWTRLNDPQTGRLDPDSPAANGDNDVAVDAAGVAYSSNLGRGIQVHKSVDGGATWTHAGNVVPEDHWADRQWMAAGKPGHLVMTWMGGATDSDRQVAVNTTFDGGATWTGVEYFGERIGWLGTVQMDPAGEKAFVPFTEPETAASGVLFVSGGNEFALKLLRTLDGGLTWDVVDTGARVVTSGTGGHWSGVHMAPAFDVTGDGTLVYAWSEDVLAPSGQTSEGAVVKYVASADGGATWTEPHTVSSRMGAIMPWVTGGAGDRAAITYFATDHALDTDYTAAVWDVMAVVVDGVASGSPSAVETVVDEAVHVGPLCSRGGACLVTGSDRALLDFFEADLTPDGNLVVVYPADPPQGGKYIDIRVAVQSGGTPLLAPRA